MAGVEAVVGGAVLEGKEKEEFDGVDMLNRDEVGAAADAGAERELNEDPKRGEGAEVWVGVEVGADVPNATGVAGPAGVAL